MGLEGTSNSFKSAHSHVADPPLPAASSSPPIFACLCVPLPTGMDPEAGGGGNGGARVQRVEGRRPLVAQLGRAGRDRLGGAAAVGVRGRAPRATAARAEASRRETEGGSTTNQRFYEARRDMPRSQAGQREGRRRVRFRDQNAAAAEEAVPAHLAVAPGVGFGGMVALNKGTKRAGVRKGLGGFSRGWKEQATQGGDTFQARREEVHRQKAATRLRTLHNVVAHMVALPLLWSAATGLILAFGKFYLHWSPSEAVFWMKLHTVSALGVATSNSES